MSSPSFLIKSVRWVKKKKTVKKLTLVYCGELLEWPRWAVGVAQVRRSKSRDYRLSPKVWIWLATGLMAGNLSRGGHMCLGLTDLTCRNVYCYFSSISLMELLQHIGFTLRVCSGTLTATFFHWFFFFMPDRHSRKRRTAHSLSLTLITYHALLGQHPADSWGELLSTHGQEHPLEYWCWILNFERKNLL